MIKINRGSSKKFSRTNFLRVLATSFIFVLYFAYVAFIIKADRGPVDFETFMLIGRNFVEGREVYIENSYYPLPYVAVFGLVSLLPRPLAMVLWLLGPIAAALVIGGYRPATLLFAPVFSHFVGGQSSVFGLLGFYGYRRKLDPEKFSGGFFLALTCLKPQLALIPVGYAAFRWVRHLREKKAIPPQAISFLVFLAIMYVPAFMISPGWLRDWLSGSRPLFSRVISSAVPRLLLLWSTPDTAVYWLLWFLLSSVVVFIAFRLKGSSHLLDFLMLVSFVVNPLMHDYDLIQLLPTIWGPVMPAASVLLSIPGWWTILFQYGNDAAWITFSLIAPGLLYAYIYQCKKKMTDNFGDPLNRCRTDRID